jgi:hypothetical protein
MELWLSSNHDTSESAFPNFPITLGAAHVRHSTEQSRGPVTISVTFPTQSEISSSRRESNGAESRCDSWMRACYTRREDFWSSKVVDRDQPALPKAASNPPTPPSRCLLLGLHPAQKQGYSSRLIW